MEEPDDAALLTEAVEQQQVKSVTFEGTQTEKTASATQEAIKEIPSTPNVQHTVTASKAGLEASLNATACCSPTGSPMRHKQHSRSRKSKHKHSKPAYSSSSSDNSDADDASVVLKKHGGTKAWRYPGLQATSSYRQLTTVGSCHQYTISGYTLAKALGPGTCLRSDLFEAGGQKFQLEVFPAGLSADTPSHLSMFLTTPGSVNPTHVLYELAVVDQSGRGRHLIRASKPNRQGPSNSLHTGVVAGYPCFVRTALLQQHQSRYLLNDSLIVRGTVEVVRSWSAAPQQLALPGSIYPPTQNQQLLQQQLPRHDAVPAPCYSPQPDYQDQLVTTYQQQQQQQQSVVANQIPPLQQGFSSQPFMCPTCCIGNAAGSNTATAGPGGTLQTFQQPCNCPACAAAAMAAAGGVRRQLGSPMQQQPRRGAAAAAGECSCAACSIQKLLQLLPALVNLQVAAGTEPAAPGAAAQPQQIAAADSTAASAAAAGVPAASAAVPEAAATAAEENSKEPASARQPTAPADESAALNPHVQNAAAFTGVAGQLAQLQQQQQQRAKHQSSCCTCTANSSGVQPTTAGFAVCGELERLVGMLQQQQQWARVCPAAALPTAGQSPMKLVSSSCSCEAGSPCGDSNMLAGSQSPLLQDQQQLVEQQCIASQRTPGLNYQWSPQQQQQQQQQHQQQRFLPAAPCESMGAVSSPVWLGGAGALHQIDTAGLAVPLVRHHPTRVVYM